MMSSEQNRNNMPQITQTWYDVYMTMKTKSNDFEQTITPPSHSICRDTVNTEKYLQDVERAMDTMDASQLQGKIFAMQQLLCFYHDLLDDVEMLKKENAKLERQAKKLRKKHIQTKKTIKEEGSVKLQALKDEIVDVNLKLSQSKEEEVRHNARIQTMSRENKALEKEIEALRRRKQHSITRNEQKCTPDEQIQTNKMGISAMVKDFLERKPLVGDRKQLTAFPNTPSMQCVHTIHASMILY